MTFLVCQRIKSMQVGFIDWKHGGSLIKTSKLNVFINSPWFLLFTVKIKSLISIILSYWHVSLFTNCDKNQESNFCFGMLVYKYQRRATFVFSPKIQTKQFQYHLECLHCLWLCMECFHWCKIIKLCCVYFCLYVIFCNCL